MRPQVSYVVAGLLAMCGPAANAQLVLDGPVDFGGTGLGSVNTVLTIQSPGSSSTEVGSVWWDGSMDVSSGDAKTGGSQTQTRSLGDLGIVKAEYGAKVTELVDFGLTGATTLRPDVGGH